MLGLASITQLELATSMQYLVATCAKLCFHFTPAQEAYNLTFTMIQAFICQIATLHLPPMLAAVCCLSALLLRTDVFVFISVAKAYMLLPLYLSRGIRLKQMGRQ